MGGGEIRYAGGIKIAIFCRNDSMDGVRGDPYIIYIQYRYMIILYSTGLTHYTNLDQTYI